MKGIVGCSHNHTEHMNTFCEQIRLTQNIKLGGLLRKHRDLGDSSILLIVSHTASDFKHF